MRDHFGDRSDPEPVAHGRPARPVRSGKVVILDTRPAREFAAGHIAGAVSVPVDELKRRLARAAEDEGIRRVLPGPVLRLRGSRRRAAAGERARVRRLVDGFPEWKAAGLPVERDAEKGAA